jgi:hypothetical protein
LLSKSNAPHKIIIGRVSTSATRFPESGGELRQWLSGGGIFGQFVDVLQGPTQPTAGCRLRIGEVGDFDADFRELPFETNALFSPLPIVSLKKYVESQVPPDLELVVRLAACAAST